MGRNRNENKRRTKRRDWKSFSGSSHSFSPIIPINYDQKKKKKKGEMNC